jgi:alkaline phosphatase D
MMPEEALKMIDAARAYNGGKPPETMNAADGSVSVVNAWEDKPPQTVLGAEQKTWFLERLKNSKATWKVWGNTTATLEMRADPENLPKEMTKPWPWGGYAVFPMQDWSTVFVERAEIYDFVRDHQITGFATIAGDRHSFWAGLAAPQLPPKEFKPVGVSFVTGSISAPGLVEAFEHSFPKDHPLRPLFLGQGPSDHAPQPTTNLMLRHGVRSCLEYAKTGDITKARSLSNKELSPHVSFVDMGGHGYSVVRATSETFAVEFVCIPRPLERSDRPDGGPLAYRTRHTARLWRNGQTPALDLQVLEGDPKFSI